MILLITIWEIPEMIKMELMTYIRMDIYSSQSTIYL